MTDETELSELEECVVTILRLLARFPLMHRVRALGMALAVALEGLDDGSGPAPPEARE
jgi:hypothetical protein